ncbi:MAG: glycosyltransferase [Paludibacter sp.]|nr:glycosyltransferase [Paludibacter sp.]
MSKRIIISVTSDLNTDQRVLKTAKTCYDNGFEVLLVGRWLKKTKFIDVPFQIKHFRLFFNSSVLFYAEYNIRLFFLLLFSRADIFLSNDTDTLIANFLAAKIRQKKLVFDAHELFPEVPELAHRPAIKKIWTKIEDYIFPHLKHTYTVCNSIAEYYKNKYGIDMKVVRNVPYLSEFGEKKHINQGEKIILYQGALNVGRGLEWVLNAMPLIENAKLVIIGDGDISEKLKKITIDLNITDKVEFWGRIEGEKIRKFTPMANLGLCLLENKGLSYYYALPNRIFDFMHAGVPILATDFPEIRDVVVTHKTGKVIHQYEPEYLARIISEMLKNPISTEHFRSLSKEFCWENDEKVILEILEKHV